MKTATRGNAAEARVLAAFVRRGFDVLVPFGGDSRTTWASISTIGVSCGLKGRLHLTPPKNSQRRGIRFAADFEIDGWTEEKLRALSA